MKSATSFRNVFQALGAVALLGLNAAALTVWAAEGQPRKSSPDALNLYADAANLQNNGAFEVAVEEWEKFLQLFPNDPLADKARHYAGVCQQQLKRFDKAAVHFAAVVARGPQFELAEDAYLNLGWCQYSLGVQGKAEMNAQAIETFAQLRKLFPKGKYVDQAIFYQGEAHYARGEKEKAAEAYKEVVEKHPASSLRSDALYALGVAYEELQQYPQAQLAYERFLREYAQSDVASEVRMRRAETVLQGGDAAQAERLFGELAAAPGFSARDQAALRQAYCAAKQGKFAAAGELYGRIATEYPQSAHAAEAALSAGRCHYRAGNHDQAAQWLLRVAQSGSPDAPEAAHWQCRIYLSRQEADKAAELADRVLAQAARSTFLVPLKMDQADALYALSEWRSEAVDKYLNIAADDPQHPLAPQALYNAAFGCWELKRYADGIRHASRFLQNYGEDALAADAKYVAAECQWKLEKHEAAESLYRELVAKYPRHANVHRWHVRLGLLLYVEKKYAEAAQVLAAILPKLDQAEETAEASFLLGLCRFQQNEWPEAEKALTASLAAHPKWRQADETLLFLSRAQHKANRLDEAQATVRKLIAEFPESPLLDQAYYRLGEYRYAGADFAGAITAYDTLISKWPASAFVPYAWYGKGWAELKSQQYAAAAESFSAVIDNHPSHELASDARFARAMCYRQTGQHQQAIGELASYLQRNPSPSNRADALYEQGLAEAAASDHASAVRTFEALLKEHPNYANAANVLYELAWAYRKLDKPAESVSAFARLAAEHGQSPLAAEAHWRVGEDHFDRGEFARAIEAYTQAKKKADAGDIQELATHKLGWSLYRMKNCEQALEQFREQTQRFPNGALHADALFMQGECLFELGRFQESLVAFAAASQTTPSQPQMQVLTLLHAGQSAAKLRRWEESLRYLDQIPAKFPDSPYLADALSERGWAQQQLGRLDKALQDYEQAAAKSPRGEAGARARFLMGEIQFERQQYDEAIKSFLRVMYGFGAANAPPEVRHFQAMAGFEAGRCAEVQIASAKTQAERDRLLADAKKYYGFVVRGHAQHEVAAQAKRQLDALARL